MKLCKCGCGQPTLRANDHGVRKGAYNDFIHGHQSRGIPQSLEHRQRLSEVKKANPPRYWLGKKMPESARAAMRGPRVPLSPEHRQKLSVIRKERFKNPIERAKCVSWLGRHHTLADLKKMSLAQKGANGSGWKGGVSSQNECIRQSSEFKQWRDAVFSRDNYTCRRCSAKHQAGSRPKLHPHHIKTFAEYPELRFVVENGLTLCASCHKSAHRKGGLCELSTNQKAEQKNTAS